jgi:CRISPR/Cas system-associated endonuclease/helicase Cas3
MYKTSPTTAKKLQEIKTNKLLDRVYFDLTRRDIFLDAQGYEIPFEKRTEEEITDAVEYALEEAIERQRYDIQDDGEDTDGIDEEEEALEWFKIEWL